MSLLGEPEGYVCGLCGDRYRELPHVCWLALKTVSQESLAPPVQTEYLEIGGLSEDEKVPARVKQVDISPT